MLNIYRNNLNFEVDGFKDFQEEKKRANLP